MEKITDQTDAEIAIYIILDKAKKNGILESFGSFISKSVNLYMKRFGNSEYAKSIPESEFTEQVIDCVEHLTFTSEDGKKIFSVFTDEIEQTVIYGMVLSYILGN